MIRLSVIIVNFNVKYFLEQALYSVQEAIQNCNFDCEVFVVDNASEDLSMEMVKERFAWVKCIENEENVGFSVANNQAIQIAEGEYVLLLNPDTLVQEDTFQKVIDFMDEHPDAGGLGVKMIDGAGKYLPESKRGLPTPEVAFYKAFGFSSLFPKSKRFGKYHLGYLDENEVHEIDVLSGAFMLMRKSVLDEVGLLDETFFMYGEDIDLSYRITLGGYKNYYYPHTSIIHYKGESTKKGSLNYVRMFYKAMSIFAKKHFANQQAGLFSFAIQIAIIFRAIVDLIANFSKNLFLPALDAMSIFAGFYFLKNIYASQFKSGEGLSYPSEFLFINVPIYILIWLVSCFFSGGFDRPLKWMKQIRGVFIGFIIISAVYGFLPEDLRFSRALILLGSIWTMIITLSWRYILSLLLPQRYPMYKSQVKRLAITGSEGESKRVLSLLNEVGVQYNYVGRVSTDSNEDQNQIGHINHIKSLVDNFDISEIIFCAKDLESGKIIDLMMNMGTEMSYRIIPEEGNSIVGSNSKNTAGDLYAIDVNLNIARNEQKRNKRVLDLVVCLISFFLSPILLFFIEKPFRFIQNWFNVFSGRKTWVGYSPGLSGYNKYQLPNLKQGILHPVLLLKADKAPAPQTVYRLNFLYAREYSTRSDLKIIRKAWKQLGMR